MIQVHSVYNHTLAEVTWGIKATKLNLETREGKKKSTAVLDFNVIEGFGCGVLEVKGGVKDLLYLKLSFCLYPEVIFSVTLKMWTYMDLKWSNKKSLYLLFSTWSLLFGFMHMLKNMF